MRQAEINGRINLLNGTVVFPEGCCIADVELTDGMITGIGLPASDGHTIDAAGCYLVPGLIDIHIHGLKGRAATDAAIDSLQFMARELLAAGITSFVPTGAAIYKENNLNVLRNANIMKEQKYPGAEILGVHLEGPFLNVQKRGAQPAEFIVPITWAAIDEFLAAGNGLLNHITLAPELDGALEAIKLLRQQGVLVAAGHTCATYEELEQGIDAGISLLTHFFNGMQQLHHREVGVVGAGLLDERVFCELICDGVHVHPKAIELVIRNKGYEKVCMVSDNTLVSGLPEGEYDLPGKKVKVTREGNFDHHGSLTGSRKNLFEDFVSMVKEYGYPIEKVAMMAAYNPAKLHGVGDRKGSIAVGKDADILVLTKELKLRQVIKGRHIVEF